MDFFIEPYQTCSTNIEQDLRRRELQNHSLVHIHLPRCNKSTGGQLYNHQKLRTTMGKQISNRKINSPRGRQCESRSTCAPHGYKMLFRHRTSLSRNASTHVVLLAEQERLQYDNSLLLRNHFGAGDASCIMHNPPVCRCAAVA